MTHYKHKNGIQSNLSKTATLKKTKIVFQDQLSLNAGQKYCIMLQGEHSAILSIFIKLPSVIKIFVLSIFEWAHKTGFTVFGVLIDNRGSGLIQDQDYMYLHLLMCFQNLSDPRYLLIIL